MTRIAFLDRDGVLNRCRLDASGLPLPARSLSEVELLPGVHEACSVLRAKRYRMVVVTNQPDVARGTLEPETVAEINTALAEELGLDDVRVCPHDDADDCPCRKPRPGLLLEAAAELDADLSSSVMVGDRWRDVEAGRRAGCATALVGSGYGEPFPTLPDIHAETLLDVALQLPGNCEKGGRGA